MKRRQYRDLNQFEPGMCRLRKSDLLHLSHPIAVLPDKFWQLPFMPPPGSTKNLKCFVSGTFDFYLAVLVGEVHSYAVCLRFPEVLGSGIISFITSPWQCMWDITLECRTITCLCKRKTLKFRSTHLSDKRAREKLSYTLSGNMATWPAYSTEGHLA